jgi:hypothetical protein
MTDQMDNFSQQLTTNLNCNMPPLKRTLIVFLFFTSFRLNAWSDFQGFNAGNDQDKLQAGWMGAIFGPAAEIMRDYPGWQSEDIEKVQDMFRRAYYPQLKLQVPGMVMLI